MEKIIINNTNCPALLAAIDWIYAQHSTQLYGHRPYSFHLNKVADILERYWLDEYEVYDDIVFNTLYIACLGHDIIEDTNNSYNDVKKFLGQPVADIIYDVTNELGKNRKERATKTYQKIMNNPLAIVVKLCDRIANTEFSKETVSTMFKKYQEEYVDFRLTLHNFGHISEDERINTITDKLWEELDRLSDYKVY